MTLRATVSPEARPADPGGPSPAFLVAGAALLAVVGLATYAAARRPSPSAPASSATQDDFQGVDLGPVSRPLSVDAFHLTKETLAFQVMLLLNPEAGDLQDLRAFVEKRRPLLRHVVLTEVLHRKTDAELRRPGIYDVLKREIRERVNAELGPSASGRDIVARVIFPEIRPPSR